MANTGYAKLVAGLLLGLALPYVWRGISELPAHVCPAAPVKPLRVACVGENNTWPASSLPPDSFVLHQGESLWVDP